MSKGGSVFERLADEYSRRLREGKAPSISSYVRDHPEHAKRILELFPLVKAMETSRRGTAARTAAPPSPNDKSTGVPERVGPYKILRVAGRGGMGLVYEGEGPDGERVAVKLIHPHLLDGPAYVDRFVLEADAGARVDHEHVARTLAGGTETIDGVEQPYLALEYIDGNNLRNLVAEVGALPERLTRHIGRCVAEALEAMHAAGVIHRDIKPDNVIVTPDETIKVTDLGVAFLQDQILRLTKSGQFAGSTYYTAPEQIEGAEPRPRTDLYALGLLLLELTLGHHPAGSYPGPWLMERLEAGYASKIVSDAPVSPFLKTLIETLMQPDPEERPETAAEVCEILERGEAGRWWHERQSRSDAAAARAVLAGVERVAEFRGRDEELETLDELFRSAVEGRGRVVFIDGEAGIGKSRLTREWGARQTRVARVAVAPHGPRAGPLAVAPLAEALLRSLGRVDLEERLEALMGESAVLARPFADYLRGQDIVGDAPAMTAEARHTGYLRLLQGLASEGPLIVMMEDLHFASVAGRELFMHLAEGLREHPVLVVGTARAQDLEAWRDRLLALPHATALALEGLDVESARDLLADVVPESVEMGTAAENVLERSGGNPLFLLEFARGLLDAPMPEEHTSGGSPAPMPSSVRGCIEARLRGLGDEDRQLLSAAACCGDLFDPGLVATALERGGVSALTAFGRIERKHRLITAEGRDYRFRHHLIHEVLYEELHPRLCEQLHASIGNALEQTAGEPSKPDDKMPNPLAAALCRHFIAAGLHDRAGRWMLDAFIGLAKRHRVTESHALARDVLAAEEAIPDVRTRASVHLAVANHAAHIGDFERADRAMRRVIRFADQAGSTRLAGTGRVNLAIGHINRGVYAEAEALLQEATAGFEASDDKPGLVGAFGNLANLEIHRGHVAEARALLERSIALAEALPPSFLLVERLRVLGELELSLGNAKPAGECFDRSVELADELGDVRWRAAARQGRVSLCEAKGRSHEALEWANAITVLSRSVGLRVLVAGTRAHVATLLCDVGSFEEAAGAARRSIERGVEMQHLILAQRGRLALGRALVALGHLAEAETTLREAIEATADVDAPRHRAAPRIALADALARAGRLEEAESLLEEVDGVAEYPMDLRRHWGVRALVHEMREDWPKAEEAWYEALAGVPDPTLKWGIGPLELGYGRALLARENLDKARGAFESAAGWARKGELPGKRALARAHLATLPDGDVLAARVALERNAERLPVYDRILAHERLSRVADEEAHMEAAARALRDMLDHVPAGARAAMTEAVPLYRRVAQAVSVDYRGEART